MIGCEYMEYFMESDFDYFIEGDWDDDLFDIFMEATDGSDSYEIRDQIYPHVEETLNEPRKDQ